MATKWIYVVGFAPATDSYGAAGFDWNEDPALAREVLMRHLYTNEDSTSHSYTFVPVEVPAEWTKDEINGFLDKKQDIYEVATRNLPVPF